jgi:hypothetical protein
MPEKLKITVFWDVALYSLVEVYRRFIGAYCLHQRGDCLMMEAVATSDTSVNVYQTILLKTAIFVLTAVRTSNPTYTAEHSRRQ